jgi:O-antigen ligase/polysaccharide polymerase Wzy-like membrane protein
MRARSSAAGGIRSRADGVGSAALAAALTLYAAFNAGGYFADAFGVIAVALLLGLALRVAVVERPFAGWARRLALAAAALTLFAGWSLLSLAWSDAAGRTLLEACRLLPYLLTLLVFGASPSTPLRLRRAAGGIALAAVVVAGAALASRLAPDVFSTSIGIQPDRLSFPLTYWNALALLAGIGLVICFAFASETGKAPTRVAAAACLPPLAVTILLTYSRGGVAIAALMLVLYVALARPAGAVTTLVATAAPAAIALAFAYRANLLASADPTSTAAAAQGHWVAAVLIACIAAAAGIQFLLVARGDPRLALPALPRSLARRRTRRVVALALLALIAVPLARAVVHQVAGFSARPSAAALADTRNRLGDPSSNGRVQYWRAAVHGFRSAPLKGTGAGTYQLDWWRYRAVAQTVTEAHSLYLQTLAETGVIGLIMLLAALVPLLVALVGQLRGPERPIVAALVACAVGWLIHAGLDWDWQMAAVTLWLFAVGGIALARPAGAAPLQRPLGVAARAALGLLLIAAAGVPALAAVSQTKLDDALDAYDHGDCSAAVDAARASRAALPPRSEPRMVLGWCASRGGHTAEAISELRSAVTRGGADWETHYGLAIVLAANGRDPRAQLADAKQLNPLEPAVQQAASAFSGSDPGPWKRPAVGASLFLSGLSYPPLGG